MGQTSSSNISEQLAENLTQADKQELFHPYLQDYTLFKSRKTSHKNIIRKIIILNDCTQLKAMVSNYQEIDKKPFNILYPYFVTSWIGQATEDSLRARVTLKNLCYQNSVAAVYFPEIRRDLVDYCLVDNALELSGKRKEKLSAKNSLRNTFSSAVKKKNINIDRRSNHDGLSETTIWFILNQISRSLEILHKRRHAHWCIMPETIFYNEHQNWFIHDSYFIFGQNYQNFLQYKLKAKGMVMSPQMKSKLQRDIFIQQSSGSSQDVYCLGFVVLYMMGLDDEIGNSETRNKLSREISSGKILFKNKYSDSLIKTVQSMIAIHESRRITIERLRDKLKPLQTEIITREVDDKIKVAKTNNTNSLDHLHTPTKTFDNQFRNKTNNFSRTYNGKAKRGQRQQYQKFPQQHEVSSNNANTRLKTQYLPDSRQTPLQPYISNERFKTYLNNLNQIRQNKQVQVRRWKSPTNTQPKTMHFRSVVYP